jgi:hypothetical protein
MHRTCKSAMARAKVRRGQYRLYKHAARKKVAVERCSIQPLMRFQTMICEHRALSTERVLDLVSDRFARRSFAHRSLLTSEELRNWKGPS